jgi:hypothetical protein
MKRLFALAIGIALTLATLAQAPQGFNYQAVLRDTEGQPIPEQAVSIRFTLQNQDGKAVHYAELHFLNTSPQGVVSLVVGSGIPIQNSFADIPWKTGEIYLKVEVDPAGGSNFVLLGISQLQSVPYALYAQSASQFVADPSAGADEPLFVVRNSLDQIVFAVYEKGVRMYVEDDVVTRCKGNKSGFAIGGLTGFKQNDTEYFRVTPDSVRIYLREPTDKGNKGGFAIGGLTGFKSDTVALMFISPDMARIYIDTSSTKGNKGGFAIGGLTGFKQPFEEYLRVTRDSTRVYVNDTLTVKGNKGGFAIGGLTGFKQETSSFMFLTPENYFIGHESGTNTMPGEGFYGKYNSFFGFETGKSNTTGYFNTFIGYKAGVANTQGAGNLFLGFQTGYSNSEGNYNSFVGHSAGQHNTSGAYNTFIGSYSGTYNSTGNHNTFLGYFSGQDNTTGSGNIFEGSYSGFKNTTGNQNIFIGSSSGRENTSGHYNVYMGYEAGWQTTGNSNVFIGNQSGKEAYSNQNVFIGSESGFKTTADTNIFIGYRTGYNNTTGGRNIFLGLRSGHDNTTGSRSVFIGNRAGEKNISGQSNIFIGDWAGQKNTAGHNNIFIGSSSGGYNTNSSFNTFVGLAAGFKNTGSYNCFYGSNAGRNNTTGNYNTYVGSEAGYSEFGGEGNFNTALGYQIGSQLNGTSNTLIGAQAGYNIQSGSGNVFLGFNAGYNEVGSNKLYIDNSATSAPLLYGEFDTNLLKVNGSFMVTSQIAANGYPFSAGSINTFNIEIGGVSPSSTNGQATIFLHHIMSIAHQLRYTSGILFLEAAGNGWNTTSTPTFQVNGPLYAAVNGGNVGIGTATPSDKLHIVGGENNGINATVKITSGTQNLLLDGNEIDSDNVLTLNHNSPYSVSIANGGGNVGVGTLNPSSKISITTSGADELGGDAMSTMFKLRAADLASSIYSEVAMASIGCRASSNIALGIRARRTSAGTDWQTASIGLGMDVDNTIRAGANIWLHANGNVGVNTTNPDQKLVVYNGLTTGKYTTDGWTHSSDLKLKENIVSLSNILPYLLQIQSVRFNFIGDISHNEQIGFIAQDVERFFPQTVTTDAEGYKSIAYGQFSAILLQAIREQEEKITFLEQRNADLECKVKEIEALKAEIEAIKALISK